MPDGSAEGHRGSEATLRLGRDLEADARRQLHGPRARTLGRLQAGERAITGSIDCHVRRLVVAMIQQVRNLRPELQPQAFRKSHRFN